VVLTRTTIFGEWLRSARLRRGLTQEQAAQRVQVTRQQWMRWEKGVSIPRKAQIPSIAAIMECDPREAMVRAHPATSTASDGRVSVVLESCGSSLRGLVYQFGELAAEVIGSETKEVVLFNGTILELVLKVTDGYPTTNQPWSEHIQSLEDQVRLLASEVAIMKRAA
jgi:transcriptional regulator with XRE-family HTH domain